MGGLHFVSPENSYNARDTEQANGVLAARSLFRALDTDAALGAAVRVLLLKTGANATAVALAKGDNLICYARAGKLGPSVGIEVSVNAGITGACVRSAKLLYCRDSLADDRVDAAACRASGIRSILVAPLVADGVVVGILEALSIRPDAFQPAHVQWIEALADWVRNFCCPDPACQVPEGTHGDVQAEPSRLTQSIGDESCQSVIPAAQPEISKSRRQQDPGLASFRVALEDMPVASTWEDIARI